MTIVKSFLSLALLLALAFSAQAQKVNVNQSGSDVGSINPTVTGIQQNPVTIDQRNQASSNAAISSSRQDSLIIQEGSFTVSKLCLGKKSYIDFISEPVAEIGPLGGVRYINANIENPQKGQCPYFKCRAKPVDSDDYDIVTLTNSKGVKYKLLRGEFYDKTVFLDSSVLRRTIGISLGSNGHAAAAQSEGMSVGRLLQNRVEEAHAPCYKDLQHRREEEAYSHETVMLMIEREKAVEGIAHQKAMNRIVLRDAKTSRKK